MGSFTAELRVAGYVIPLIHCRYGVHQSTGSRGRADAKVRYDEPEGWADVPEHQFLEHWAANPTQQHEAWIVVSDDRGQGWESVHLKTAYCVLYREHFRAGDAGEGAYTCHFRLSDPGGYELVKGGPPNLAAIRPLPGSHGAPQAIAVAAATAVGAVTAAAASRRKQKDGLAAGTPEHKAARWAEYQRKNANNPNAWNEARWTKQYETNMRNPDVGLKREREYAAAMGAVSKTLKTPLTNRQIDLYKADELYCGQLKTGKMSLNKQARAEDIPKDAELVKQGFAVEYILEKGGSKPFLAALDEAGATYKLGPQIP